MDIMDPGAKVDAEAAAALPYGAPFGGAVRCGGVRARLRLGLADIRTLSAALGPRAAGSAWRCNDEAEPAPPAPVSSGGGEVQYCAV
mmetsp:Transcript_5148/g.13033  ORF Transcript_5148/g.13033 Transcript_5148/m.13033 type:complete len:87 (-) Transcript_5148:546-806(-)